MNQFNEIQIPPRNNQWPNLPKIASELLPVEKLPLKIIPAPLRPWLRDIAHRMQCPLEYVATASICMISSIIGTKCGIRPKKQDNWTVIPNLWGAIIGNPSTLKTPAILEATRPLEYLETQADERFQNELKLHAADKKLHDLRLESANEQLRKMVKTEDENGILQQQGNIRKLEEGRPASPRRRRFKTSDATMAKLGELYMENPAGFMILREELSGFLVKLEQEKYAEERAFHLESWTGCGRFVVDRIERGTLNIPLMCSSIFGSIQPAKITPLIRNVLRGPGNDGLLQRFQLLVYPDPAAWQYVDLKPDLVARDEAFRVILTLATMDFEKELGLVLEDGERIPFLRFDEAASEFYKEWLTNLERNKLRNQDEHPVIIEHLSKYRSLMPSLAGIFHILQAVQEVQIGPISLWSAELAAAWTEVLESHARRVYHLALDLRMRAASVLVSKISRGLIADGFTARDVYRRNWSLLSEREVVEEALDELTGDFLRVDVKSTGGKPLKLYRINPKLLKHSKNLTDNTDKSPYVSIVTEQ